MVSKLVLPFPLISGTVFTLQKYFPGGHFFTLFQYFIIWRFFQYCLTFITSACLMSCTAQRIQNLFSVCSFFFTVLPVNSEHFFLAVWLYITFLLTDIYFVTWFLLYCFTALNVPNIEGPPLHIKLFLPCKLHTKILYDQMWHRVERLETSPIPSLTIPRQDKPSIICKHSSPCSKAIA